MPLHFSYDFTIHYCFASRKEAALQQREVCFTITGNVVKLFFIAQFQYMGKCSAATIKTETDY